MDPIQTGRINEHLCTVNLGFVNIFLYQKDHALIAFDAGYGKGRLRRELRRLHIDPMDVTHVFLSHSDFDHAGCLDVFPKAALYLSEDEERLIKPPRPLRFLIARNRKIRRAYTLLGDGETVSIGGVTVKAVKTPGHTPGSMAYLVDGHVLFSGDTLSLRNGQAVPNKTFAMDMGALRASAKMLAAMEGVTLLVTAHMGVKQLTEDR
jgi:glyoxylase-like metal-dependent hydrolase (beta-lactamase superfamily II)